MNLLISKSTINNIKILKKIVATLEKRKTVNLVLVISTIGLVGCFFLVVPIGTGPDSGAHSVVTYCAEGSKEGVCEYQDIQKDIVYREVKIASGVSGIGICHGNNLEKNASERDQLLFQKESVGTFATIIGNLFIIKDSVYL